MENLETLNLGTNKLTKISNKLLAGLKKKTELKYVSVNFEFSIENEITFS